VLAQRLEFNISGHTDIVNGVAFSPDGKRIATASWDFLVPMLCVGMQSGRFASYA